MAGLPGLNGGGAAAAVPPVKIHEGKTKNKKVYGQTAAATCANER